jgi:gingipain R
MNKITSLFFISTLFFVYGQKVDILKNTDQEILVNFEFDELVFNQTKENETTLIDFSKHSCVTTYEKGAPALPFYSKSILIPGSGGNELQVSYDAIIEYNLVDITPSQGLVKRNSTNQPLVLGEVYSKNEFYPGKLAMCSAPFLLRELRGQTIKLFPYQYNPVTKVLRFYKNLSVHLKFTNTSSENELFSITNSMLGEREFSSQFINYKPHQNKYLAKEEEGEMLVICPESFKAYIQPLVDWKNQKGIKTTIQTIENIGTTSDKIKQYISDYYLSNPSLLYLLLVGDHSDVPAYSYGTFSGDEYWSDSYYGQLSGNDMYSELFVGRFSGSLLEVETMVKRTLEYEKSPKTGDWMTRAIGIASSQGLGIGDDGEIDWQHERKIRNTLMASGYSSVYEFYDGSQGDNDADNNPTNTDIVNALNTGVGLLNYTGHGDTYNFVTSNFSSSDILTATNSGTYPFVISVACNNGKFVNNKCMSETWLTATKNNQITGAIAACGSSILMDWAPPMKTQDEIVRLLTDYTPSVHKYSLGGLFNNGQFSMLEKYGTDGDGVVQTWVFFGDPSTVFRSKLTQPMDLNVTLNDVSNELKVVSSISDVKIGVSQNNTYLTSGKILSNKFDYTLPQNLLNDTIIVTASLQNHEVKQVVIVNGKILSTTNLDFININIFPNPCQSILTITSPTDCELSLFSLEGKLVQKTSYKRFSTSQIDVSNLEEGSYLIQIEIEGQIINKRLEIVR